MTFLRGRDESEAIFVVVVVVGVSGEMGFASFGGRFGFGVLRR